jgi:hypothetical protein
MAEHRACGWRALALAALYPVRLLVQALDAQEVDHRG